MRIMENGDHSWIRDVVKMWYPYQNKQNQPKKMFKPAQIVRRNRSINPIWSSHMQIVTVSSQQLDQ